MPFWLKKVVTIRSGIQYCKLIILAACKKREDGNKYYPGDITGNWYNKSDGSNNFSFKVITSPLTIATTYLFEGTEIPTNGAVNKVLHGNYNEKGISWEYSINGVSSGIIYIGTINENATSMTLKKPDLTTITLLKK
jgi:hypothetical protein